MPDARGEVAVIVGTVMTEVELTGIWRFSCELEHPVKAWSGGVGCASRRRVLSGAR